MLGLLELIKNNYHECIVVGAIMVSAIIVFIGIMKPLLFNKITCKPLRKVLLAFSDVFFSFVATFIYFVLKGWTFENYLVASVGVTLSCIVAYWFYENTCLRDLIDKIGSIVVKKAINILLVMFTEDEKSEIEKEIKKASEEIKKSARQSLISTTTQRKKDKELNNL